MENDRIAGESRLKADRGAVDSRMHMSYGPGEGPDAPSGSANDPALGNPGPDRIDALRDRATDLAQEAGDRVRHSASRLKDLVEERTGILRTAHDHPLITVGLAFSAGLLIAVSTGGIERHWVLERARRQLKAAIISGLTVAATTEFRELLGAEEGFGNLVRSYLHDDDEDDFDI